MLNLTNSLKILKNLNIAKYEEVNEKSLVEESAKIQFPLYLKINSGEHKAKLGAVRLCNNFKELQDNFNNLSKKFSDSSFIIQEKIDGQEMVLGIKQDKTFGKLLMIGIGGSLIEQIKDIKFRKTPVSNQEIKTAIEKLQFYEFIKKKLNESNLASLIDDAIELQTLNVKEADLNPVILTENKAVIVDARIES